MLEYLQWEGMGKVGRDTVQQAIEARIQECGFHPVRDYLNGLQWDGTERLSKWLPTYLGAADNEYSRGIGRMFLISMVARIFGRAARPTTCWCWRDRSGELKSTACAVLGGNWFSDNLPDIAHGKEAAQHLRGKWLIEIAEMHAMNTRRGDAAEELHQPAGRALPPALWAAGGDRAAAVRVYRHHQQGRLPARRDRRAAVLAGKGRSTVKIDELKQDRDQLFAEAVVAYRAGEHWWPTAEFEEKSRQRRAGGTLRERRLGGANSRVS